MYRPPFGTVEYYKSCFDDIVCDAPEDPNAPLNILKAFEASITDWLKYHSDCVQTFEQLHSEFLSQKTKV